jgi:iron(III) transport system substrate-binding protein
MSFFRRLWHVFAVACLLTSSLAVQFHAAAAEEVVNIYSYREPGLIEPMLKAFTEKTGIKTNMIFSKDGLVERMSAEGNNSPADVLLTNECGFLVQAKEAGVTQPLKSAVIEAAIPAELRDPEGHWFALTRRARVVYASKERVSQDAITYEELADPKWKGKICIRSGQHTYNVALVASMIANLGEEKAEAWLVGLRNNQARKPAGGDREGVRDVQAGLCDLAVGNTYYMQAMLNNPEQKAWADAVKILFPNAADRGTHVNVSGGALAAHAPNKANAVKLMEFLVTPEAQELYAHKNGEYPVVPGVEASDLVKSWGALKPDPLPLDKVAGFRKKASELIDKVRFDAGPSS